MVRTASLVWLVVVSLSPLGSLAAPAVSSQPATVAASGPAEMLPAAVPAPHAVGRDRGYRGIWWAPGRPSPLLAHQLTGGLALEPMDHTPVAHYAAAVERTFFVYAGTDGTPIDANGKQPARIMVSYYDHQTRTVPVPVILLDNLPLGARGCPALSMDAEGRLWVFVSILGAEYPSVIFRSAKPHEIDAWERVTQMEFQHPQVWYVPGQGFMLLHYRNVGDDPRLHFAVSPDGLAWSKPVMLAGFGGDQGCISGRSKNKIGVAFKSRQVGPTGEGRTDLFYIETPDFGKTWQVYPRKKIEVPIATAANPAGVYGQKNWRFFLRDLAFDSMGNPVILYLVRLERRAGAAPESRIWTTSRWIGREWETNGAMFSDSDHDAGCLEVDRLIWTVIIPSRPGPQPNSPGGEIMRWRSEDQGRSWFRQSLMPDTPFNHNWVRRPVDANDGFTLLWADGSTRGFSESRLYFADADANVYVLPAVMNEETARPELVLKGPPPQTQPAEGTTQPNSGS